MTFTRSKTIWLICVLALAVLSLRPDGHVTRGLSWLLTPTRVLAALASPLRVFDSAVYAAEPDEVEARRARCRQIRTAFRESARPRDPALASRAVVVEAEVLERTSRNRDQVIVRVATSAGVEPGVPAVCGDAYVGRVVSLDPHRPDHAQIELVTGQDFRVGAAVSDEHGRSHLIVGGLAPRHDLTNRVVHLAVHNPSNRKVVSGVVRVAEPAALALDDEDSRLADNFLLGELREFDFRHKKVTAIRPALDLEAGLFHVALLVPLERAPEFVPPLEDLFEPQAWCAGKLLLAGEVSGWRAGRKLTLRDDIGVSAGSAVIQGARFIGRVEKVGTTLADVRLVADPGLAIPALAVVHGEEQDELVVLGTLISLGRADSGNVELRWETDHPLGAAAAFGQESVSASLYTGSGQRGIPLGLVLGVCELPTRAGTHRLELEFPKIGSGSVEVRRLREGAGQ